ncbi:MAG: SDR family oxidoreductase, partial [Lentisphaeria bacterium]|nr:SDR family oxidoreductase [Lentisphaeria bacterium]
AGLARLGTGRAQIGEYGGERGNEIERQRPSRNCHTELSVNPEALAARCKPVPSGRLGEVEDIIGPMLFLAGSMSEHVHGQTLIVDGGFTGN